MNWRDPLTGALPASPRAAVASEAGAVTATLEEGPYEFESKANRLSDVNAARKPVACRLIAATTSPGVIAPTPLTKSDAWKDTSTGAPPSTATLIPEPAVNAAAMGLGATTWPRTSKRSAEPASTPATAASAAVVEPAASDPSLFVLAPVKPSGVAAVPLTARRDDGPGVPLASNTLRSVETPARMVDTCRLIVAATSAAVAAPMLAKSMLFSVTDTGGAPFTATARTWPDVSANGSLTVARTCAGISELARAWSTTATARLLPQLPGSARPYEPAEIVRVLAPSRSGRVTEAAAAGIVAFPATRTTYAVEPPFSKNPRRHVRRRPS